MSLDVDLVRSAFPALTQGVAHFDGPGGSQTPRSVAQAVAGTMTAGLANRGTVTEAERRAEEVVVGARSAIADLVGGVPQGVVFGRSMTQVTFDLARTLARGWGPGDELVVTRLDHDGNIRPWVVAAESVGATVRWAEFDPQSGELATSAISSLLSDRTRLVAVTGASNLLGTRPDVAAIATAVHDAGALFYLDAVHLVPHAPVDLAATGADVLACSPYKFFGPHLGCAVAAPELLESLHPAKLLPSSDAVPERFEVGTLPYELLAGTTAAVDFIADLDPGGATGRRDRILASMASAEAHEDALVNRLRAGLDALPHVTLHGSPARHTPTLLFSVAGHTPREVHEALAPQGINAPGGSFYALEAARWMGLGDAGGVRTGLAPYTNDEDVDRLLVAVDSLG